MEDLSINTEHTQILNESETNIEDSKIINIADLVYKHQLDFKVSTDQIDQVIDCNQNYYEGVNRYDFDIFAFASDVGRCL